MGERDASPGLSRSGHPSLRLSASRACLLDLLTIPSWNGKRRDCAGHHRLGMLRARLRADGLALRSDMFTWRADRPHHARTVYQRVAGPIDIRVRSSRSLIVHVEWAAGSISMQCLNAASPPHSWCAHGDNPGGTTQRPMARSSTFRERFSFGSLVRVVSFVRAIAGSPVGNNAVVCEKPRGSVRARS
jgi:hypothetical protein